MKPFRIKLFVKVVLLMLGLSTIPLTLVGTRILKLNRDSLQYEVLRYHTSLAQNLANKLDVQLSNLDEKLDFAVNSLHSEQVGWAEKQSVLQGLVNSDPKFAIIAVVAKNGKEFIKVYNPVLEAKLASFPELTSHADDPLFQQLPKSEERIWDISNAGSDPRLRLYYPFQTPTGVHAVFMSYSLNAFWKELADTKIGGSGFTFLVDREGTILAHPDNNKILARESARGYALIASALAGNAGASEFSDKGSTWVGSAAPVKRLGGAVMTLQPRDEAYAASIKGQRTAAAWILLSAVIAAFLAALFARRLTRPILQVIQASREVNLETGHFPPDINVASRDEIGELADTFNAMTKKLKSYAAMQLGRMMAEKNKTEAIIYSIDDGLIMTDHESNIEFINGRAREFLGITQRPQEMLDKPLWDFIPRTEVLDILWDMTHNIKDNVAKEVEVSYGNYRQTLSVSAASVRTPTEGEDMGIVIILRNITLEKQIEQMKDDFIHSITHDLRNPMTSIRGFLKFLIDELGGPLTDQQRKMVETMDRASMRLLGMINDILDVAKLEAGKIQLNLAETDLRDTARHVNELLQTQATKKQIELVLDAPEGLPKISVDPMLMERLYTNLIGNAIKFTPEGGRITVQLVDKGDSIYSAVTDSGEGIPPDYLNKIFDKFQQVAGQRKGGTGLGLTICKYIVESHKGDIFVESEVGKGSKFQFTIPKNLRDLLPAMPVLPKLEDAPPPNGGRKSENAA